MQASSPLANSRYGVVLRSLEGLRNPHALTVLLGGFLLVVLTLGLGNALALASGSFLLGGFFNLLALLLAVSVFNAAGLALMDGARDQPPRAFAALLAAGAACFLRFLAIGVLAGLSFLAFLLLAAVLLFICKLPFLGPLLLVVILPVLVLAAAALLLALFVGLSMLAPALWEGHGVRAAITRLVAVASQRPLEVLISLVLLGLLCSFIGSVASMFVFAGGASVGGLAASILGASLPGMGEMQGMAEMGGGARAMAGGVGLMIVFALLGGALAAIQMNGLCHIYLQACEGVADEDARQNLGEALSRGRAMMGSVSGRVADAAREVSRKAQAARPAPDSEAPPAPSSPAPPQAAHPSAPRCPACQAPVNADDRFCGECGHRLAL